MKVVCTNCKNSWELAKEEIPAGTADFDVACGKCGSKVTVSRQDSQSAGSKAQWFVAFGRDRKGPFDEATVRKMIADGEIAPNGFVWKQGFDNWKKASEVPEFASSFQQGAGSGDAGMVWQRRETSVLFSLDDYKQRKATRSQGAIKESDVVDVRPLEDDPSKARKATPVTGAGMISFDEAEVQRVADAIARKKKTKRSVMVMVIVGGVLLLAVAAGLVVVKYMLDKDLQMKLQVPPPVVVVQQQAPAPAPAPEPGQPTQAVPAPAVAEKQAPAPVEPVATQAVEDGRPAGEDADARREDARKAAAARKGRPEKAAEKAPAQPERQEKVAEKQAEKPVEKAKPAPVNTANDANALLAQLHKGKSDDGDKKKGSGTAEGSSGLPDRLTVSQVSRGFGAKKAALDACVRDAGEPLPYKAQAKVEIEGSGRVVSAKLVGGGNAKGCLEGVLRSVTFDRFGGENMKVPYTISVK